MWCSRCERRWLTGLTRCRKPWWVSSPGTTLARWSSRHERIFPQPMSVEIASTPSQKMNKHLIKIDKQNPFKFTVKVIKLAWLITRIFGICKWLDANYCTVRAGLCMSHELMAIKNVADADSWIRPKVCQSCINTQPASWPVPWSRKTQLCETLGTTIVIAVKGRAKMAFLLIQGVMVYRIVRVLYRWAETILVANIHHKPRFLYPQFWVWALSLGKLQEWNQQTQVI